MIDGRKLLQEPVSRFGQLDGLGRPSTAKVVPELLCGWERRFAVAGGKSIQPLGYQNELFCAQMERMGRL